MRPDSPAPARACEADGQGLSPALVWRCLPLHALSALELHRIHMARQAVFVVEQHCAFQDADTADEDCWHLSAWRCTPHLGERSGPDGPVASLAVPQAPTRATQAGPSLVAASGKGDGAFLQALGSGQAELAAYARLVPPGVKYTEASIGRVITTAAARGTGLGRLLVARAVAEAAVLFPGQALRISAQSRLEAFYEEAGFQVVSARYLEDGIDHTEMWRPFGGG